MAEGGGGGKDSVERKRGRTNTVGTMAQSGVHTVTQAATELLYKDPPPGFFAATAEAVSHAPTIGEIRRGSFGADGWHAEPQVERRRRTFSQGSAGKRRSRRVSAEYKGPPAAEPEDKGGSLEAFPALTEEPSHISSVHQRHQPNSTLRDQEKKGAPSEETELPIISAKPSRIDDDGIHPIAKDRRIYSSGYIPPPIIPWTTSTAIALKAFGKWFCTPFGFLVTIYGLNVVAWGGMLFLLLCNASYPMCWAPKHIAGVTDQRLPPAASLALNDGKYPRYLNCNDINSPRRIWIEIDSQILNALFCVTGFGLIPWRFRDWWYLLLWRCSSERRIGREKKMYGLRVLAGIHRGWFRLGGSETLDEMGAEEYGRTVPPAAITSDGKDNMIRETDVEAGNASAELSDLRLPLPTSKTPDDPLTGIRAPPTALWKLDFFVWSQVLNTFLQCCLCGFMWGMTRYNRPSWATGLFIGLACIIAGLGGLVSYLEGRKVKRVEGVRAQRSPDEESEGTDRVRTGQESFHLNEEKG